MASKIAERLLWSVHWLGIRPTDHVLEIGCGHGVAVSLICDKLTRGKIIAIDQSDAMIEMAKQRNHQHIESGKAELHAIALKKADLSGRKFDKIFAINVNVFWQKPTDELNIIRDLLNNVGSLHLFYQPPAAPQAPLIVEQLKTNLQANKFSIREAVHDTLQSGAMVVVSARA